MALAGVVYTRGVSTVLDPQLKMITDLTFTPHVPFLHLVLWTPPTQTSQLQNSAENTAPHIAILMYKGQCDTSSQPHQRQDRQAGTAVQVDNNSDTEMR